MEPNKRRFLPGTALPNLLEQTQTIEFRLPGSQNQTEAAAASLPDNTPLIFSVAAGLMGVSLSGIGLFAIVSHMQSTATLGEEALALNASIFGGSCVAAYFAMKCSAARRRRLQLFSEGLFLFGLTLMAAICVFLAVSLHHAPKGDGDWLNNAVPDRSTAAGQTANAAALGPQSSRAR